MERILDRTRHVDLRSLNYPVLTPKDYKPRSYTWSSGGVVLDQGAQGACVGFGWAHELAARPAPVKGVDANVALQIYRDAQKIDEWAGEEYEGTSVLAGAKTAQSKGYITEYRWCLSIEDLVVALGYHGPVVIGVDWYTGMFSAGTNGFIKPTGRIEGGHCVMLNLVRLVKLVDGTIDYLNSFVGGVNSWGGDWGINGRFKIALIDMMVLFPGGDFAVPMGRKIPA